MASEQEQRLQDLAKAVAEDLRLFAMLHGGELSNETVEELRQGDMRQRLGLVLESELSEEASTVLGEGIEQIGAPEAADALDADYADIYLTHRLQLSPFESPWLDEDGLVNGGPMFAVRDWYARYGLEAEDWRKRADDHLSLQLTFIAHLFERPGSEWQAAGEFMDEHLLRWLGRFAQGVAQRAATPFYAGLAMLTFAYMEELRAHLETITGKPRTRYADDEPEEPDEEMPFVPGSSPGW